MLFSKGSLALATALLASVHAQEEDVCASVPSLLTCRPAATPPTLDGDFSEWPVNSSDSISTPIYHAMMGAYAPYPNGNMVVSCSYDDERIYFAIEVPGAYRFDPEDNHLCAGISTMFKMGEDAELFNMGNCPMAATEAQCNAGGKESCDAYKVDIGGHWELATTEQGVNYPINVQDGTGDDLVANKDDEYSVSPYCRFDDDDDNAGNEWAGAWVHGDISSLSVVEARASTTPAESYKFEMSRLLKTNSEASDKQLEAGEIYSFGLAYWDPFESEETGWSDSGHYVTGCAKDWIDIWLAGEGEEMEEIEETPEPEDEPEEPVTDVEEESSATTEETSGSNSHKYGVAASMAMMAASSFLL